MIITSQGDRSAKQRRLVRETWLNQIQTEYQPARIAAKFFVGRYSDEQVLTDAVAAEMLAHGDTVVVDVGDAYNLPRTLLTAHEYARSEERIHVQSVRTCT